MKHRATIHLLPFLLLLTACRSNQPCPDCDSDDEQFMDLPMEVPDLPCGGADLQSDDANCGECGNSCLVRGSDEYEAGHCLAGECGPTWWSQEWPEQSPLTCGDVCETVSSGAASCQVNGCVGFTGVVCESVDGGGCSYFSGSGPILAEFTGSCSEALPWPDTQAGGVRVAMCCCG